MFAFTDAFVSEPENTGFLQAAMMGPNALRISEEMASYLPIGPDMRILDLGCGCGFSTLLLAKKYGATVFAADLWIDPTENHSRFQAMGIDQKAIPFSVDVTKGLPFARNYFDLLFCVDAYHYFGRDEAMLPSLIPYVKKGGYIAVAVPGWQRGLADGMLEALRPHLSRKDAQTFQTLDWWKALWGKAEGIAQIEGREMICCQQAWAEWLTSPSPYAAQDIAMIKADAGQYFNIIQLVTKVL